MRRASEELEDAVFMNTWEESASPANRIAKWLANADPFTPTSLHIGGIENDGGPPNEMGAANHEFRSTKVIRYLQRDSDHACQPQEVMSSSKSFDRTGCGGHCSRLRSGLMKARACLCVFICWRIDWTAALPIYWLLFRWFATPTSKPS